VKVHKKKKEIIFISGRKGTVSIPPAKRKKKVKKHGEPEAQDSHRTMLFIASERGKGGKLSEEYQKKRKSEKKRREEATKWPLRILPCPRGKEIQIRRIMAKKGEDHLHHHLRKRKRKSDDTMPMLLLRKKATRHGKKGGKLSRIFFDLTDARKKEDRGGAKNTRGRETRGGKREREEREIKN